jgi:hypothetical protein
VGRSPAPKTVTTVDLTDPFRPPPPMRCPQCGRVTGWYWDADEEDPGWDLDGDWWYDPKLPPRQGYVCSRWCYVRRGGTNRGEVDRLPGDAW